MKILLVIACTASLFAQSQPVAKPAVTSSSRTQAPDAAAQRAVVDEYCVVCHNKTAKTANLLLDQLDLAHLGDHAEIGCNAVLNPGSIIGPGSVVYPNTNWRGVLAPNSIVKNKAVLQVVSRKELDAGR